VGKELRIETFNEPFIVTGLMDDLPSNSHFHFDILGSLVTLNKYLRPVWVSHNVYTYIKTAPGTKSSALEHDINGLVDKYVIPEVEKYLNIPLEDFLDGTNRIEYKLQPLKKIHLSSNLNVELETNARGLYVYAFGIIAFLIIFIACLNFINLATANSANRAREVVLRKIVGSEKKMLIFQFLTESVLFSFFSLFLALLITEIAMPYFNKYLSIDLQFTMLNNIYAVCIIILLTFFLGLLAGSYPAFFISSYEPVKVLHGILNKGIRNKKVREVFVVIQFFISILIIIMTIVVIAQVEFMLNKELGFEKERILVIRRSDALKDRIDDFKSDILQNPNIESVSNSNSIPGRDFLASSYIVETDSVRKNLFMNQIFVNYDFMKVFGLVLSEGRFLSPEVPSDSMACVINETAAREIKTGSVIGTNLEAPAMKTKGERLKIIGVVRDFHFESVDKPIEPLVISLMPGNWEGYLNVKLSSQGVDKSIKFLEQTWKKYTTEYPFLYFFLEKDFDQNYRSVIRTSRMLLLFAILSIFVALLGLFGLIIYTTNQRKQEIGIRKAVGASYYQIIFLLIKETVFLILYASVAAWAIAYLFSQLWLKDFNSRISLSPKYFLLSSGIVMVLALMLVIYHCYLASRSDPAEALKAE
jgi:putative ABC transport system permease protein